MTMRFVHFMGRSCFHHRPSTRSISSAAGARATTPSVTPVDVELSSRSVTPGDDELPKLSAKRGKDRLSLRSAKLGDDGGVLASSANPGDNGELLKSSGALDERAAVKRAAVKSGAGLLKRMFIPARRVMAKWISDPDMSEATESFTQKNYLRRKLSMIGSTDLAML